MSHDYEYLKLLQDILDNGVQTDDRTGVGTISVFGRQLRFDLSKGFPLLTTKKMFTRGMIGELLWFISGSTNVADLIKQDIHFWTANAYDWYKKRDSVVKFNKWKHGLTIEEFSHELKNDPVYNLMGELGPSYGYQLRRKYYDDPINAVVFDQLSWVINEIKTNPNSRRLMISFWDTKEMLEVALPCCHGSIIQFNVSNGKLNCATYQRSADFFLGFPLNISSYSLLVHLIAKECNLEVGELIYSLGDAHIYLNHIEQAKEQLSRTPYESPILKLNPSVTSIFDYKIEDITIENYTCHPAIKAPMAV